ncbi:uncharacterized protein LOC114828344 [Galendromus occidentalis]|uniref:Uncharacterized protein LOC114828344 n=1 Tax=Galendromus occidentalis TaxID=34638 RepID=A0AAJ7WID0_9ACAR|nr:uncharacterized protein LOC114828344 [Galendromus occidentalis]
MHWISLPFVVLAVTITACLGASPNNASDLLQNHAPDGAPAPVYLGSRTQESAYQDYLAQLTSQQAKKDKDIPGGPSTASIPKFDGQYGMPTPVPKKKHKKPKPTSTASPSMYADYGYADEDESPPAKSYYAQPVKHKYAYTDHKDYGQDYHATAGSSPSRNRRPYEAYYEQDYEDPHGYYQAEASSTQQQTAPPPDTQASGPPPKVSARPIHKGKIVNGEHIKASASEYYGGYGGGASYGGVAGYDDFYGGGGYHGGYHHSPPYRHHHRSSKGPLALLLGLLPLGLLFASIVPSLYSIPFAAFPQGGIPVQNIAPPQVVGRRRRDVTIQDAPDKPKFANPVDPLTSGLNTLNAFANVLETNPVIKAFHQYGFQGLENPSCVQKLTCETFSAQTWMQMLARSYDTAWAEPLGLKPLVKAIATKNCDMFRCSPKNDERPAESNSI